MAGYHVWVLAAVLLNSLVCTFPLGDSSNFGLSVIQLATKYGYPSELYEIITEDGYILQMERIPHGIQYTEPGKRPAVLLVPGLLTGSVTYANFGPAKSLAFILADHGYDVWLLNYRGTKYSRKHATLNPDVDRKEYWDYSFVEIGAYDIPAGIDKVLIETGEDSLIYIGHSLGTADLFALLSRRPEYNNKVKLMIALAPVLQLHNTRNNLFTFIGPFETEIQAFTDVTQTYEVLSSPWFGVIGKIFCSNGSPFQSICAFIFLQILGYSPDQLDKSQLPVILSTTPAGSSIKSMLHSAQLYKTGRFAEYDYGREGNLARYGGELPPLFDVGRITTPIAIYYGGKDAFVSKADVEEDARLLPSLRWKTLYPNFNHVDFLWGKDAPTKLYPSILFLMDKFRNII